MDLPASTVQTHMMQAIERDISRKINNCIVIAYFCTINTLHNTSYAGTHAYTHEQTTDYA